MTEKKCTKDDLGRIVACKLFTSQKDGYRIVQTVLDSMHEMLEEGHTIYLRNFGTFHIREMGEKPGRNPKTGETFTVPAKRKVLFRQGKRMKREVNL